MPDHYETTTVEPPLESWAALLSGFVPQAPPQLTKLRTAARRRLVDAAQQFILRLQDVARNSGLSVSHQPVLTGDPDVTAIVMTGHQPVIFHSGLVFKYQMTEAFAAAEKTLAVAVVIDSDEGDAGEFAFPVPANSSESGTMPLPASPSVPLTVVRSMSESLSASAAIYSHSRLRSTEEITAIRNRVSESLTRCGCDESASLFRAVAGEYTSLQIRSAADANLIVRRQHGIGTRMLELPLSAICSFPEVLELFAEVLTQGPEFARRYNQLLDSYRSEHKLKNVANPFPNLATDDSAAELPFWIVDHQAGRRETARGRFTPEALELRTSDRTVATLARPVSADALEALLLQQVQLFPRGALITAMLRVLFSDLFVHGTGGGRYDQFTDSLIRSWWNAEPTPFTVASASRFLFPEARQELQRLQSTQENLRDLMFNTHRYIGSGAFPAHLESQLTPLVRQKSDAVAEMSQARKECRPATEIGRTIRQLTDQIRELIDEEFTSQLAALQRLSESNKAALNNRTWPWFLFPGSP